MRRPWLIALSTLVVALLATPVLAQAETQSWARMFIWTGDLLGRLIILLLLLASLVNIGFALMLLMRYRKATMNPPETAIQIETMLSEKRYREAIDYANNDPSYLGQLISAAMAEASNGFSAMERALEEASEIAATRMLRPVEYLNVMGNISPMLGLFGTVYGMIVAFQKLVNAGGQPDPGELAEGISTALVTTFWGLVVAIPALAAYAVIRNKIDALSTEGLIQAEDLISPFKPGGKRPAAGGSSAQRPRATPKPDSSSEG